MQAVINFSQLSLQDVDKVGAKNASLGEMFNRLTSQGVKVPPGFAITAEAYLEYLKANQLDEKINSLLQEIDVNDLSQLHKVAQQIRQLIIQGTMPVELVQEIKSAYQALDLGDQHSVAVRSSATAEDLVDASFAGQQESYLNIKGEQSLIKAIQKVFASLFTDRAIAYRTHQGFDHFSVAISVAVQVMVRSDLGASGVLFTMDTESGFDDVVFITSSYGLGESVVKGLVSPDEFYVHKTMLKQGKRAILSRNLGRKTTQVVYGSLWAETKEVKVPLALQQQFSLTDDEVLKLAKASLVIEKHFGKAMDIEWAKDGVDGELYVLQARPETVCSHQSALVLEQYELKQTSEVIARGRSVGRKIGSGVARVIKSTKEMHRLQQGEILVTDITDPNWEPVMKRAAAIITNRGGRTCHAAIIARELGIPALVGTENATSVIRDGDEVTVDCSAGEEGLVYAGLLQFDVRKTAVADLPELPVKLLLNLGNPEQAFTQQSLPNRGVGLARLEFIISNMIGIHPNAILNLDKLESSLRSEIEQRTSAYSSPREFYVERLAEGVATIGAAFYPKPVIVRFSDFKSNEYATLLGGSQFEPLEENPMLGYRGASRYTTGHFSQCFALECEAIKRVREEKGLTNVHVMFPFVRTVSEMTAVAELTEKFGLRRGEQGLMYYMMCEVPANAVLAEEFLPFVDGFSIGSNDLTQLTLGLDRDSPMIASLFDERDEAVKVMLQRAIQACRRAGKHVGICGQGPSDHVDFAEWLMAEGIDSISLAPDTVVSTWLRLAEGSQQEQAPVRQGKVLQFIRQRWQQLTAKKKAV